MTLPAPTILYSVGIVVFFEVTRRTSGAAIDAPELFLMSPFIRLVAACEMVARWREYDSAREL